MEYNKIAGAPISWGVCEVPGWGHQMAPARVLGEMAELGLVATEFGPLGFLPVEPAERASSLATLNMHAVGGFFPVILHRSDVDPLPTVVEELKAYIEAGADTLVLAADSGLDGYDVKRPELDADQWNLVFQNLNRINDYAASLGIKAVLHPHVGTIIETREDVLKVVEGSQISFCLDTGHMFIGGTDPVWFSGEHAKRVAHSHLKDVDAAKANRVQSGEITYYEGVVDGMYKPLGQGDVGIADIVRNLLTSGYQGWLVLEQDLVINEEPALGAGPLVTSRQSVEFLRSVIAAI
jgi:inosose dehydratase